MRQSNNAGIKRNRRPTGTITVEKKINIDPEIVAALDAARRASGNLSLSLYIERLARQLEAELGQLPVFHPTLEQSSTSP